MANQLRMARKDFTQGVWNEWVDRWIESRWYDGEGCRIERAAFEYATHSAGGEIDFYEQVTYDNLDRAIETERYDTTSSGNLRVEKNESVRGRPSRWATKKRRGGLT